MCFVGFILAQHLNMTEMEEKQVESPTRTPDLKSVEMLEAFVKRLTATNETLALSVAQLSVLIDLELHELRQIYKELGMSAVPEDISLEDWLLAIRDGSLFTTPKLKEESPLEAEIEVDLKPKVKIEEAKIAKDEINFGSPIESPPSKSEVPPTPEPPAVDAFAFYFENVAATIRRKHNGKVSDEWLRPKLAAKWASLSTEEKMTWQKAAEASSRASQ
ncbi:hypothetical protein Aperf_G00000104067 [Anoplocephala perfoliata]